MSRKSKISFEDKLKAVTQYIEGKASSSELALQYGVDCSTIRKWIKMYQSQGPEGLQSTKHNQSYTTGHLEKLRFCIKSCRRNLDKSMFEFLRV
ncbi:transposase [Streptococcus mitis]|nr:transposase [Streptococcus sp. NLN76]